MQLNEFIKTLFTSKQSLVVETVWLYINNRSVYNVVINIDPAMSKKAKRLGFESTVIVKRLTQLLTDQEINNGRCIIIYDNRTHSGQIFEGEQSESEQQENIIERLRNKRFKTHRRY